MFNGRLFKRGLKMKNVGCLVLSIALLSVVGIASADITLTVTPTLAPNVYGSPSYAAWQANEMYALENGLSSYGDPSSPTYYQALANGSNIGSNANLVTTFNSWNGVANPTGAFANELGNRLMFGLVINGNGTKVDINNLFFNMNSDDLNDTLAFSGNFQDYGYNDHAIGVIFNYNDDGQLIAPTLLENGEAGTTPVDEIIYRGVGNAWWPGGDDPDPGNPVDGQQGSITDTESWISSVGPIGVNCVYFYPIEGSQFPLASVGNVNVVSGAVPVPVPAAVLLGIGGLSLVGLLKKRFAKSA
jgi:hypothetical protein